MSDYDTNDDDDDCRDEINGAPHDDDDLQDNGSGRPSQKEVSFKQGRKALKAAVGTEDASVAINRFNQLTSSFWAPTGMSREDAQALFDSTVERLLAIAPQDPQEEMLTSQMISTHNAAMECLRRAHNPTQSFEGRDANLKHAEKLMALYTKQLAALDKHRGKGQQKVTVEHVHVEAGGQAIVGNVGTNASEKTKENASKDPGALLHAPEVPLTPVKTDGPAKTRRREE